MTGSVVHCIWDEEKTRRVDIYQRDEGNFGFEDLSYDSEEDAWIPKAGYSESFTESLEAAIREARARVSWLSKEE